MENRALLSVLALLLVGIVTIMLARTEGDGAEDAVSGAAFEQHRSSEQQSYPSRRAVLDSSATSISYDSEEFGYSNEEEASATTVGI